MNATNLPPDVSMNVPARRILHIDMDAFYASVEQRDQPALRGKAVAVGGRPGGRGVVAAASYEARAYGVRSAMPVTQALRLCPDLQLLRPRFDAYRAVSQQMRQIFQRYTQRIEPLSLDEAYLDISEYCEAQTVTAVNVAKMIRKAIYTETALTASAGVSYCRFIAKLASDYRKPNGLTVVTPEQAPKFLAALPVERFFGVGPSTAQRLHAAGLYHGAHLQAASKEDLIEIAGRYGQRLWELAQGIDHSMVQPRSYTKSIGHETTFAQDQRDLGVLQQALQKLVISAHQELLERELMAGNIAVKLRDFRFQDHSRQLTLSNPTQDVMGLQHQASRLLDALWHAQVPVRLLGVRFGGITASAAIDQLILDW